MEELREAATFYRAALWLGLVPGEEVVHWADQLLESGEDAAAGLCDVALTPPGDLSSLRAALQPMAEARESERVVNRLLALVARDLAAGRRNAQDTLALLGQMYSGIALSDELRAALHPYGIHAMFGSVGVQASSAELESRLVAWLLPYVAAHASEAEASGPGP